MARTVLFLGVVGTAIGDDWTVQTGIDACPSAVPGHSELHASTATLEECQASCEANSSCKVFTWNQAVPPHHCFWCYDAHYTPTKNTHCVSGCLSSGPKASRGCPGAIVPEWAGTVPSKSNASAGLPLVPNASHVTVYNATANGGPNPFGTYNHGPIITHFNDRFWMSWYNSPKDESTAMRSVYATSEDGNVWSPPQVLFPNLTKNGQENGPWLILNGRLYTQSGDQDAGLHIETIVGLMRRVGVGVEENDDDDRQPATKTTTTTTLGEPFWLNDTVPTAFKSLGFKTYLEMDNVTRADAQQYLQSSVRTLIGVPDEMKYNERSLYLVPKSRLLVNLLRGDKPNALTATTCQLPLPPAGLAVDETGFSCRPGVGDVFYNLPEVAKPLPESAAPVEPRTCNWSAPVVTTIPDSHSRTCAAAMPTSGDIYIVGNQLTWGSRDPVTLAIAHDGITFDQHWAVRAGAPPVLYPGHAKGPGFQYPGAAVVGDEMFVSYSIGKEDIGLTRFPLSAIGQPGPKQRKQ